MDSVRYDYLSSSSCGGVAISTILEAGPAADAVVIANCPIRPILLKPCSTKGKLLKQ